MDINLRLASDEDKNNFQVVIACVTKDGANLKYASQDMQSNLLVVATAVASRQTAIKYAHHRYYKISTVTRRHYGSPLFHQALSNAIRQFKDYLCFETFLKGWLIRSEEDGITRYLNLDIEKSFERCELQHLQEKLGKYYSLHIKRLIADFVGIGIIRTTRMLRACQDAKLRIGTPSEQFR
jgi:hypothetical protein